MPIFIGIFYVIRLFGGTPGVTDPKYPSFHDGGILWFQNLSAADPYLLLPIISALTMLAATEITAKNLDPQQRWMMRILPLGITVFLYTFPAGLFVYWITSNLVTFVQNFVIYNYGPGKKSPTSDSDTVGKNGTKANGNNASAIANSPTKNGSVADVPNGKGDDVASVGQSARAAKRRRRKKKK